jgi:hypothetical protein
MKESQNNDVSPQFIILNNTINNIIDLSKKKRNKAELKGQLKIAQCLITQVLA